MKSHLFLTCLMLIGCSSNNPTNENSNENYSVDFWHHRHCDWAKHSYQMSDDAGINLDDSGMETVDDASSDNDAETNMGSCTFDMGTQCQENVSFNDCSTFSNSVFQINQSCSHINSSGGCLSLDGLTTWFYPLNPPVNIDTENAVQMDCEEGGGTYLNP